MRPVLLDLYSCAGGAAAGYHRAGFRVVGVDSEPQPHYPYEFHQGDALEFLAAHGHEFAAVHASCPCQVWSDLASLAGPGHVDWIPQTRTALQALGVPWVIENVEGAPLDPTVILCGSMFDLGAACRDGRHRTLRRHRLFESSFPISQPVDRCEGRLIGGVYGDGGGGPMTRGYKFYAAESREAMGIDWMSRPELSQAIPPAYAEHIGHALMAHVLATGRAAA